MSNALVKSHLKSAIKSNSNFSQAHYELAKIFLEEQNIKSAIISLKNAIDSGLEKSLASKKRGESLLEKRQFPQAKRHMFKMGSSKFNTSIYFSELAQIYLNSYNYDNAKKYANYSLEEYANQPTAMYILGCIYTSNNKWEKAAEWFSKSLELDFNNARTHLSLAHVKQKQKKPKEAIHHYLIAKDLDKYISSISLDKLSKKHPEL
jgi:tetratricopeptide (TPR) repeat protein